MSKHDYYICDPEDVDTLGFQKRNEDLKIKDCILILAPQNVTKTALLVSSRSKNTILDDLLRTGERVLHLDKSRVSIPKGDTKQKTAGNSTVKWGVKKGGCSYNKGTGAEFTNEGRFPTNLIIRHDPKCLYIGTKEIKGVSGNGDAILGERGNSTSFKRGSFVDRTNENGNEVTANWNCVDKCPVPLLDQTSGDRPSNDCDPDDGYVVRTGDFLGNNISHSRSAGYADEGGASRYYKQVRSKQEVTNYLNTLLRGKNE